LVCIGCYNLLTRNVNFVLSFFFSGQASAKDNSGKSAFDCLLANRENKNTERLLRILRSENCDEEVKVHKRLMGTEERAFTSSVSCRVDGEPEDGMFLNVSNNSFKDKDTIGTLYAYFCFPMFLLRRYKAVSIRCTKHSRKKKSANSFVDTLKTHY